MISSHLQSFISVSRGAKLNINNSSFIGMSSMNEQSGLMISETNAQVVISNSIFQNNSAVTSSLFSILSGSKVI